MWWAKVSSSTRKRVRVCVCVCVCVWYVCVCLCGFAQDSDPTHPHPPTTSHTVPVVAKRTFLDMLQHPPVSEHDAALPTTGPPTTLKPSLSIGRASHAHARDVGKGDPKASSSTPAPATATAGTGGVPWVKDDFMTQGGNAKHWDEESE